MARKTPSYKGLKPASDKASKAARGSSKKTDTKPEKLLRSALWERGLRYRKNVKDLPGKPDIVFTKAKVVVFVDGDFWHGRDWPLRKERLLNGTNPDYWISKIEQNIARDHANFEDLCSRGWTVLRFWESIVLEHSTAIAETVFQHIRNNLPFGPMSRVGECLFEVEWSGGGMRDGGE